MANVLTDAHARKVVQAYLNISATRSTSGDGTAVVAAPGATNRNALKELTVFLVDTTTTVTVVLKLGDVTYPGILLNSTRDSLTLGYPADEEFRCSANGAVYVNLDGAVSVGCIGRYFVEAI